MPSTCSCRFLELFMAFLARPSCELSVGSNMPSSFACVAFSFITMADWLVPFLVCTNTITW